MKTNYRPRSNAPAWVKRLIYTCLVLAATLVAGIILRGPLLAAAAPVWKGSNFFSETLANTFKLIQTKDALIQANQDLGTEVSDERSEINSLTSAAAERDTLLATFGRGATTTGIAASVLVHPPQTAYDVVLIDAGTSLGVASGYRARLPSGAPIGSVTGVSPDDAQVTLSSASGLETNAVLERGQVAVKLTGLGGGTFKTDLPKSILVVVGDRVLDPGLRGELVGVVESVSTTPSDSAEHVLIRGVANPSTLRFVLITSH
jgi:cell shape-determining protein MreC